MRHAQQTFHPRGERGGAVKVVLVVLGSLTLAGLIVAAATLWYLSRHVKVDVRDTGSGKQVEIETPFGGLKVRKADDVARELKLPVYPGAQPDESAAVEFWAGVGEERGGFDLAVAEYYTDDQLEEVAAWYRKQLGPEFRRESGRITRKSGDKSKGQVTIQIDEHSDGVAYIDERGERVRGVALEPKLGRVRIALFDVSQALLQ